MLRVSVWEHLYQYSLCQSQFSLLLYSIQMNHILIVWIPPPLGYVKINVFEEIADPPHPNGNSNSIGMVMLITTDFSYGESQGL